MSKSYESPTLTDLGSVEDLTQTVIRYKSTHTGLDISYNRDKQQVTIGIGKAGVEYISGQSTTSR